MTEKHDETFERVVRVVREAMIQHFHRDPIVVQAQDTTIHIEHPSELGTFLTREYSRDELARETPELLAEGLLLTYAGEKKRSDFLAYARAQFPEADDVQLLDDDFDVEVVGVQLEFHGVRVRAGLSRPLWDHARDFEALRAHMERHGWKQTVNGARGQKVLLGENGWIEWK